jgi:glycosyltransferase involved in cell wall biosynthesis
MAQAGSKYDLNSIAVIGNYLPRHCGIATFTTDLCNALGGVLGKTGQVLALAMDDIDGGYDYPERVKFQLRSKVQGDYLRAAEFLNVNQFDVVVLQHEYGIFGGKFGSHILTLLRELRMPVLTTLHTVLAEPTKEQRRIIEKLGVLSERLVVMSQKARELLVEVYGIAEERVCLIPHGIHNVPFVDPSFHKDQFDLEGKKVILTFGLLSPGKGIENMIEAMPAIVKRHPEAVYMVLGATHPHIKRESGDSYLVGLQQLAAKLGVKDNVRFHNRFVEVEMLCQYIGAADIYVTPYINEAQITSGTLAYALGAGKAVVSTPYWHAAELLADQRGQLVPFADSSAMSGAISDLLSNDVERNAMRKRAYQYCRPMSWDRVGGQYLDLASEVIKQRSESPKPHRHPGTVVAIVEELPEVKLKHLGIMTDDTGVFQHAKYATPDRNHGYCTDDNARALIVASAYRSNLEDPSVDGMIQIYLSFLLHAFNSETRRFRNFMSYDRKWLEDQGSEDSHGRAVWGLGKAVKYVTKGALRDIATRLFVDSAEAVEGFSSPRAWAFGMVGLQAYLEIYGGDAGARRLRSVLGDRFKKAFDEYASEEWYWFEEMPTYANAKIPHAMIMAGQWGPDPELAEHGLKALKWLLSVQNGKDRRLSVIGNNGWLRKGSERARFDQQPIEAMGLVEACCEAYRFTGEQLWLKEAQRCLEWFLGRNDLSVPLCDFATGGCCDGLSPNGANANQGAESTLAWLIALLSMTETLSLAE